AHGAMEETAGAERGFDLFKFVRHPRTIVRLLSWLFGMVVFACITTEGYINTPFDPEAKCIFNQDYSTCRYAVSIGVIGFLACVFFLLLDIYLPFMSIGTKRKTFVLCLCICVSVRVLGVWTFLWFVCFCLLAAQWARTKDTRGIPQDAAHATIAFSFFSMATWVSGTTVIKSHCVGVFTQSKHVFVYSLGGGGKIDTVKYRDILHNIVMI
uniref:MARVEL domain-containing protein n=1 Tax=Mola mola TaxID=94237 RepID=A0A3Q3W6Y4_MOLML